MWKPGQLPMGSAPVVTDENATQRPNLKDTCPPPRHEPLNKAFNVNLNGLKYFFLTYLALNRCSKNICRLTDLT